MAFTLGKLIDYKIDQRRDGNIQAVVAFMVEGKIYNYEGSFDKTERTSKTGKPYDFFHITRNTLEDLGMSPETPLELLADQELKKKKPILNIGKEFTIELKTDEYEGKSYTKVYRIKTDKSLGLEEARQLLAGHAAPVKATGTNDEEVPF